MFMLGSIGFTTPWLLLGLLALPLLWILLRAVPPAPVRRLFPGLALLLGLTDDEHETDTTPWWLLLLRMAAIAAVIVGFAGPVLNPQSDRGGSGPLLVLLDGTWADARDWAARMDRLEVLLDAAGRDGRPVAVVLSTDLPAEGAGLPMLAAEVWQARLPGLTPQPWLPDPAALATWVAGQTQGFDTYWMSDGLSRDGRDAVLEALEARGAVTVFESPRPVLALRPPRFDEGEIALTALRSAPGGVAEYTLIAQGPDPNGVIRTLASETVTFDEGTHVASASFDLPPELRNRIRRFELSGQRSAGAVTLSDDSLKRREVALLAGRDEQEELELLSPLHYLRQALVPTADIIEGALLDVLPANPDVIVLADVATVSEAEQEALLDWIDEGGLLLRFSGPLLAGSDVSRGEEDPLMPVRLRAGGRTVGGAMSWGEPKTLQPFPEESPFRGLNVPEEVQVSAQVVAQPGPDLAGRTIAALTDGTPLVTRKRVGQGQIVLFHVTANAEWSNLPLSGLFVQMLERLAVSTRSSRPSADELEGTTWVPESVLSAFGTLRGADNLPGISGKELAQGVPARAHPPGLYTGEDRRIALNVTSEETELRPAVWPARIPVEGLSIARETGLKGAALTLGLLLLLVDILASLALSGRFWGQKAGGGAVAVLALGLGMLMAPPPAAAQGVDDGVAIAATSEVVLAYVRTGTPQVDEVAEAGMRGLSEKLFQRTSVEPADPVAVDLEVDELSFYPFLYWPITADQPLPSAAAYAKLNRYLRSGGMIMFDTRDADITQYGGRSAESERLQLLARPLDIPPLEPIPPDHVLTRTFYLLQDFPGRHTARDVWVEAAPPDAEQVEGMPFRNLNDGVTPVVIGGNDWAAAWAVDRRGMQMFPVGRGFSGERQREIAYRFGINLIMHVLTGNYKSDQVHVPALLDRLGQ